MGLSRPHTPHILLLGCFCIGFFIQNSREVIQSFLWQDGAAFGFPQCLFQIFHVYDWHGRLFKR